MMGKITLANRLALAVGRMPRSSVRFFLFFLFFFGRRQCLQSSGRDKFNCPLLSSSLLPSPPPPPFFGGWVGGWGGVVEWGRGTALLSIRTTASGGSVVPSGQVTSAEELARLSRLERDWLSVQPDHTGYLFN